MQATSPQPDSEEQGPYPPDVETMRATTRRFLAGDAEPPTSEEVQTLILTLRGHLAVILPEVGRAAAHYSDEYDMARVCARVAVAETRRKLCEKPGPGLSSQVAYARRLSRSLNALCDHHETLSGARA